MSTRRLLKKLNRVPNISLRLILVLFFVLSSTGAPVNRVFAEPAGTALQFNGSNQYVTFGQTRMTPGTFSGSPTWNTQANSKLGRSSLTFNGSSQYVSFGNAPELGLQTFTIETWFYRTAAGIGTNTSSVGGGGLQGAIPLVSKGRGEGDYSELDMNYFLGISSDNKISADFEDMDSVNPDPNNHAIVGTTTISNNIWYHAAVTFDGATFSVYLDGNLEASVATTATPRYDSQQHAGLATALNSSGTPEGFFAGRLDEARIWSVALSQSEIQANMNSEILVSTTGLVGRWGMNDASGSTVSNLNRLGVTSFTLEAWVKRAAGGLLMSTGTNGLDGSSGRPKAYPVLAKGMGENETPANINTNWFMGITQTGMVGADFEDTAGGGNHPAWGTTSVPIGEWHHIAASYTGSCWDIYVDGFKDTLDSAVTRCPNATPESTSYQQAALSAGINSTGGLATGYFSGVIDEARIWNRALSETEIHDNRYSELSTGDGLVASWSLNDGSGTTVVNSFAGSPNGTLTNSPTWVDGFPLPDSTPPGAPTALTADGVTEAINLSWTAPADADIAGYNVYQFTEPATYDKVNSSLVAGTTYTATGLTNGTPYTFVVTSVDTSDNKSGYSDPATATPEEVNAALQFDGVNDYVTFGPALDLGVTNFTLETWFYWTGGGTTMSTSTTQGLPAVFPLVSKGRGEADGSNLDMNYFLGIDNSTHALAVDFEDMDTGMNYPFVGTTAVTTNAWHHAAVTYDSVNAVYILYLDGSLAGTEDIPGMDILPRSDSIQHAAIASALTSNGSPSGYFQGKIDEVRIWNVVRTQTEIRAEINNELTSGTGLVARWGMNEGSGTTIDSSIGSFTGTLTNGPTWVTPGAPFDITFDTTPPSAPTGLTAIPTNQSISLDWDDNSESDLAGYNVYRGTTPGDYSKINSSLVTSSTYSDNGLNNGTEYFYTVRAVDTSTNESADSDVVSAIPSSDFGSALEFTTASGTYVTFGDPDKLDLATFTLETWFKRTGAGTPSTTGTDGIPNAIPLVTHGAPQAEGSSVDANWVLVIDDTTDTIAADFEDMASGGNHPVYGVTPIANDFWHHAAATWDGSSWKLYLDGHLEKTLAVSASPRSDTTQQAALGTMLTTTGEANGYFQGVLDEARVWNRALTQNEILENINNQITNGSGLVARWGLNEASGTDIHDSIATPADGTVTGTNYAWVPGAPFNLNLTPDVPTLVAPANGATDVSDPVSLTVHASDPVAENLTVSFYGRPKDSSSAADFTLIAIPDPQYYAASHPEIYDNQMNWVVANQSAKNIVFTASLGDNVDNIDTAAQWTNATHAWDILTTGEVPYGMELGNHDGAPSNTSNFNSNFGTRISTQSTYGGRYGTTDYDNTYSLFSVDGMDFIVLFIEYDTSMTSTTNPVLVWANTTLQENSSRRAIVITHDLLSGNSFTGQGSAIYNALKANPNLFLMLGGHLDTTGQRSDVYDGHVVYSLRSDYQFIDSQQSGYLRVMRFSPSDNKIYVTTYSPTQNLSLEDSANQFVLDYPMAGESDFAFIGSTVIPAGSDASVDWSGLSSDTEYEWYAVSNNGGDFAISSTWSFTTGEISNNQTPIVTNPGTQTDPEGTVINLQVEASDSDLPTLEYSAENLPDGLSINSSSGLISGTITYTAGSASPYASSVTVSDETTPITVNFTWNVTQAASGLCGSDPTLVGCWPMEEGSGTELIDATANGNDAVVTGAPSWITGKIGQGLDLSGTGQYATVPDSNSLDITDAITLSAWIKPEKTGTQNIFKKTTGTTTANGYELSLSNPGYVFIRFNGNANYRLDSTITYPNDGNTWMHIAATYDGTTIRMYINGELNNSSTPPSTKIVSNITALGIGAEPASTRINLFQGVIDDARIYNRALSLEEIQALAGLTPPTADLTVTTSGTGSGTVTSTPEGINCGLDCSETYDLDTVVSLSADADSGSYFSGWSGAGCSGTDTCQVTMTEAKLVDAEFSLVPTPTGLTCVNLDNKPATTSTGEKPQSKVWTYNNAWYAVFPTNTSGASSAGTWVWKMQGTTWVEELKLSSRTDTKADVKVVGNLAHILLYADSNTQLASIEFNAGHYQLWTTRTTLVSISLPGSEIATIDQDFTGRMWIASRTNTGDIVVYYSDSPYGTWTGPVVLASGVIANDDIDVITALPNGTIGVLWSNENANVRRLGFRIHTDGADPNVWAADEVPASQSAVDGVGAGMADDHMNIAVGSDSTLYAAVKTSYDTAGYPKIALLVRHPNGTWDDLYGIDEAGTRPIILLDESQGVLTIIYTSSEGYNPIVYRQSPITNIAFGEKQTLRASSFNDASSMKTNINDEFVVIYSSSSEVAGQICTPTSTSGADLSIIKSDGRLSIHPNDTLSYTITAINNGPLAVVGANITDEISTSLTNASWTCTGAGGGSCTASGIGSIDDLVNLPNGASVTYLLNVVVSQDATGDLNNTATIAPPVGITDPLSYNNSASDTDVITPITSTCEADPTLVGCWQMEEDGGSILVDGSDQSNDASLFGSPTWTTGMVGEYALDLNGSTQYGLVPDNTSIDLNDAITISVWIKPEQYATQDLIKKATNGSIDGFELSLATTKSDDSSRKPFFRINQNSSGDTYRINGTTEYPTDGTWMHLAATFDGSTMRLYVNGILESSMTVPEGTEIARNSVPLSIGAQNDSARYFMGWMDDARLYNRALSAEAIRALPMVTHTISGNAGVAGAVLNYFDETEKTVTANVSGDYTISVPYKWSGTVTPSKMGYTFSPEDKVYENVESNQNGQNFIATPIEYTLTITSAHGTVALDPQQDTYHYGDDVSLTVTQDPGWTFSGWTGDLTSSDNPLVVTVHNNMSLTANYTQDEYTLTITSAHGTVALDPQQDTYHYGDEVSLTVTQDPGWTFSGWTGDLTSSDNPLVVTVHNNMSLTANYTQDEYTLTITSAHGTVALDPQQDTYHYGDEVSLTVTQDPGWTFSGWTGDLTSSNNPLVVTVHNNMSLTANYTQDEYTLTITSAHGTVALDPQQDTYHYGDEVSLTVTQDPGWTFSGWTGDLTSSDNPLVVTVHNNMSLTANYTQDEYTLTITSAHGTVALDPQQDTYHYGDEVSLTSTPQSGWSFHNWSGDATGSNSTITITITGNMNITANFIQYVMYLPIIFGNP